MIFHIDENWRIAGYFYGWRIERPRTRRGNSVWEPCKWFTTLEGAALELRELMVRTSDAETLAEALAAIEKVNTSLSQALPVNIGDTGGTGNE